MKLFPIVAFFSFSLLFVACSSTDKELLRADGLMENASDSALHILQRIKPEKYNRNPNRAFYALLMSQAMDKNDIKPESDSLIRIATSYYNENNPFRAAYSYLYLARCENSLGNKSEQALALLKAQEFASKCISYKLQGLIYGDKADMYTAQSQLDSAIHYNKLCFSIFQKGKDKRNTVLAAISIGNGYRNKEQYDSAMTCFLLAVKLAKPLNESLLTSTVYRSLGVVAFKQNKFDEALHYLRQAPLTQIEYYNYNKWYLMANVFLGVGKLDSVKVYLNKVKTLSEMAPDYYRMWQEVYEKQGKISEALFYAKRVAAAKDSLQERSLTSSFAGMEKKYRYERLTIENKNLIIQNKQNGIILLIALLSLSLVGSAFLLWRFRANKQQLNVQKQLVKQGKTLMKTEKENSSLLHRQMKMQHVLLKNVEQYRTETVRYPVEYEDPKKIVGSKKYKISPFHEELISHIDVINNNISVRLAQRYPDLTKRDLLICCLLLSNFDTGMIATILEVQSESMNTHRSRLRKKLQLDNSENLLHFLRNF